jgi:DUF4097 and DUF4098 domain-containing protein YvlB
MMLRIAMVAVLIAASVDLSGQGRRGPRGDRGFDSFGLSAEEWCRDADRNGNDRYRASCDVREESLSRVALLDVDPGGNGGIRVRGTSGSTTRVRFRVVAYARDERDAREVVSGVRVSTSGGRIRVDGPQRSRDDGWWNVQVEIETPRDTPLALTTNNGGIALEGVSGRTRFETSNGGVSLVDVSGDVQGRTSNGGITVRLQGSGWQGDGLNVETTNGGVNVEVPTGYNADLHTETTNGGISVDFPVTVSGRLSDTRRRLDTTLGSGGAPLRIRTANGGVRIVRR